MPTDQVKYTAVFDDKRARERLRSLGKVSSEVSAKVAKQARDARDAQKQYTTALRQSTTQAGALARVYNTIATSTSKVVANQKRLESGVIASTAAIRAQSTAATQNANNQVSQLAKVTSANKKLETQLRNSQIAAQRRHQTLVRQYHDRMRLGQAEHAQGRLIGRRWAAI